MSKHTQENILAQPGVAMSAQANQSNSDVLQLLQRLRCVPATAPSTSVGGAVVFLGWYFCVLPMAVVYAE